MKKAAPSVYSYHVSRFRFASRYTALVLLLAFGVASYILHYNFFIYASSLCVALLGIMVFEIKIRSNKIVVDHDGILIRSGFLSKNSTKINYRSISDIRIRQSPLQRMLGYGNLEIGVPGSSVTQNFTGKGDVRIENFSGLHSGVVLSKFQKVRSLEGNISSRISKHRD